MLAQFGATCERRLKETGTVNIQDFIYLHALGMQDQAFSMIDRSSFADWHTPSGLTPTQMPPDILFGATAVELRRDPRFVILCGKLGMCAYWSETQKWPDLAEDPLLEYDLRQQTSEFLATNP